MELNFSELVIMRAIVIDWPSRVRRSGCLSDPTKYDKRSQQEINLGWIFGIGRSLIGDPTQPWWTAPESGPKRRVARQGWAGTEVLAVLSFPASPLDQQVLGRLAGPGSITEKQEVEAKV